MTVSHSRAHRRCLFLGAALGVHYLTRVVASIHPHEGPAPRINQKLLRALVAEGVISQGEAEQAELYAKRRRLYIEEGLIEAEVLDETQLLKFQASYYKTYFVSTKKLSTAPISDSLLKLITHKLAAKLCIFPVKYEPRIGELSILTVEPDDPDVLKSVQMATRVARVRALVARPAAIMAAIRLHFMNEVSAFSAVRDAGDRGGGSDRYPRVRQEDAGSVPPPAPEGSVPPLERNELSEARRRNVSGGDGLRAPALTPAGPLSIQPAPLLAQAGAPALSAQQLGAASLMAAALPVPLPAHESSPSAPYGALSEPASAPSSVAMHDFLETLNVFIALLEQERGELRGHSTTVARISRSVCERLGLKQEETDTIVIAAYLHDIGKISAQHLTALNVAQYEAHRSQAKKSYLTPVRLFESVRLPEKVGQVLGHLYERLDGQGFPDRLSGKEIPLGSRVLAIVETYADLVGHGGNAFRRKLTPEEAWEVLARYKGKLFDPNLVDVLKLTVLGDDLRAKLLADKRRALIVDTDAEETTVLELRLAEHGFEVAIARNVAEAENELASDFDVVISEVELKPQDGFVLLEHVRANGNEVPFVFLSHRAESELVQRGFELGADDFITKPASPEVVALKINRVLQGSSRKRKGGGVSGSLTEMALPDVVQILFHGRKTGKLAIASDGKRGEIQFCEGQIFDANFADLQREEAFYEMLALRDGDFELDTSFKPSERKIAMGPESLLLEGMRRMDESGR
ncbi:MAG TPA: HD domain-containing phosphohydrolase [Polyangiales bacterium]|nr:HD domain-containing phosphohydrolase [Polyangiales bacterium]